VYKIIYKFLFTLIKAGYYKRYCIYESVNVSRSTCLCFNFGNLTPYALFYLKSLSSLYVVIRCFHDYCEKLQETKRFYSWTHFITQRSNSISACNFSSAFNAIKTFFKVLKNLTLVFHQLFFHIYS
jgi:hypothetical protein